VVRRHYKSNLPKISDDGLRRLRNALTLLKKLCREQGLFPGSVKKWTPQEVIDTRAPSKKASYTRGFETLAKHGWTKRSAYIKVFVKDEKGCWDEKPCRLIQYRAGMEYTCALAQYLAPLEHALYKIRLHGTRLFAKGLNPKQRAEGIVAAGRGPDYEYRMLDHSAFDAHVSMEHLLLEHAFYQWIFPHDRELQKLLACQLRNNCRSGAGVRWKTKGGRMSGDFNTALGNSLINTLIYLAWAEEHGVLSDPNYCQQVDGDDSWLLCRTTVADPAPSDFTKYGMTTKLEGTAHIPEGVGFCQSKPVQLEDGWMMCRDYKRVLARLPYTVKNLPSKTWPRYARGVSECEKILGQGVPVLDAIQQGLCREFCQYTPLYFAEDERQLESLKGISNPARTITARARVSYAMAWDISPSTQETLEACLLQHSWAKDYSEPARPPGGDAC